jgi:hypothetical protein
MTRSDEATARRAAKRKRSVEEQRRADAAYDTKKWEAFEAACAGGGPHAIGGHATTAVAPPQPERVGVGSAKQTPVAAAQPAADAAAHPKDWKCPACGNLNWARRAACNSKTCQARASEKSAWAPQADADKIQANMQLRHRYATDRASLTPDEVARAEALLARDEKKRQKKLEQANTRLKKKKK